MQGRGLIGHYPKDTVGGAGQHRTLLAVEDAGESDAGKYQISLILAHLAAARTGGKNSLRYGRGVQRTSTLRLCDS